MAITRNLYAGLKALRFKESTRTIWVDALCINQENIEERNHQVQLMAYIYSGAERVVVWLGDADAGTGPALDMISQCENGFETKIDSNENGDLNEEHGYTFHGVPPSTDPKWKLLGTFLLRPWFKRAWVVQEVALAKVPREVLFVCGTDVIPWERLLKAMYLIFLTDLGHLVGCGNESIIGLDFYQNALRLDRNYMAEKCVILRFEVLLFAEGARLATDDRDRVFALWD